MIRTAVWLALLLLAACASAPRTGAPPQSSSAELSRQILLTVHQDAATAVGLTGAPAQRYQYRRGYGPSPSVERILQNLAREHHLRRVRGWPIVSLDVYCEVLEVPEGADVEAVLEALKASADVGIVQPMNTFRALGMHYDDPFVNLQRSVLTLDIESAHELATGKGVLIAVIDSGVDGTHPDLKDRVRLQRDLVERRVLRSRPEVHGTAVAGVIASAANNAVGIVGVAPGADLAGLRACWSVEAERDATVCSSLSLAEAIDAALDIRPNVINMSLAGPDDPLVGELIDRAIASGIVVVAAESDDPLLPFPASHHGVIAAYRETGTAAGSSALDSLRAPSDEVLSTTVNADYGFFSGSSLAAAHVTGVIALMLERFPSMSTQELTRVLKDTTEPGNGLGLINACRALAAKLEQASCLGSSRGAD